MPTHEFLLLHEKDGTYHDYAVHFHNPQAIRIDDDIILYIIDTLKWIPTINPANSSEWVGHGLNYYGPTVINKDGAEKAARIFTLWAALMREGPEQMELTGSFEWTGLDSPHECRYAPIKAARESVANSFQAVAELAEQAATGKFFVLHLGI